MINKRKKNPRTIIIICTHLLEEAETLADDIFFLSKGQIVVSEEISKLKQKFGIGHSIKVYKKNEDSDLELTLVEDYIRKINSKIYRNKLTVKFFKSFLKITIKSRMKHITKNVLRTLELFFGKDFSFYLNSTSLEDVYFNIGDIISKIYKDSSINIEKSGKSHIFFIIKNK